jgi:alkylation response protein AidB-like acyl-CoA dehydrogenase
MDFTMTDEQQLLTDTARSLLSAECPPAVVRASLDDPAASAPLWKHLKEWVVLGDGPLVDLCLFLEQCGLALAPGPYLPSVLALSLLRLAGVDDLAGEVASGSRRATVAPGALAPFVMDAADVDVVVVLTGESHLSVHGTPIVATEVETLDGTRRLYEIDVAEAGEPLAQAEVAPAAVEQWFDHAWIALAAEMVGGARRMLDMTVAYAKERVQFDQPIGAFQAVQHQLADMAFEVERATAAVYEAAMVADAGRTGTQLPEERRRAAHVAKAAAGAAATRAAKQSIQTHGGIGYTWEHDLHLYIRRAYASEHLFGTRSWHHDRLADLLLSSRHG